MAGARDRGACGTSAPAVDHQKRQGLAWSSELFQRRVELPTDHNGIRRKVLTMLRQRRQEIREDAYQELLAAVG